MTQQPYSLAEVLYKLDNVSHEFDGKPVLKNVSAEIQHIVRPGLTTGQIVGILGPSGCGKTTLFRIMSGLLQPTSGRASINGWDRPVKAGEVGVVAQNYPLFEHRTVLSNLLLAARRREKDRGVAKDKVYAFLEEFDLSAESLMYPAQLSGGQRQRCSIIQQVLCSERFILLDEPFASLDLIMLEKTCTLLDRIANMVERTTIIVVTHDVTAAASIADHLWLLGRQTVDGKKVPGAGIVKKYDLIELDLCWHSGRITSPELMEFVREVKDKFRTL